MIQGGLHFALKAHFEPDNITAEFYYRLVRKFVLPGTIFFSFFFRYASIENTLVPLNRIVEKDYCRNDRNCPWLSKVQGMNERVFAFDARNRDVVGLTMEKLGRAPTINDIVKSMVGNYEVAYEIWEKRQHRSWGLFRSMWPGSVLVDRRLDRQDPETFAWLVVFLIMLAGCALVSCFSLYFLFQTADHGWLTFVDHLQHITDFVTGKIKSIDTESSLANTVLLFHAVVIVLFLYRTVRSMFHFAIEKSEFTSVTSSMMGAMPFAASMPGGLSPVSSQDLAGVWTSGTPAEAKSGMAKPRVGFAGSDSQTS